MASQNNYPLDNLSYDLITIIHEKSKGLEAYDKYERDAQGNQDVQQLLRQIRQRDEDTIGQLTQQLQNVLGEQSGGSMGGQSGGQRMGGQSSGGSMGGQGGGGRSSGGQSGGGRSGGGRSGR